MTTKFYIITLLLGSMALVALTDGDCNNPFLQRPEIIARFGGSQNIMKSPATANGLPICKNLEGNWTCVNSDGYKNLQSNIQQTIDNLVADGTKIDQAKFVQYKDKILQDPKQCLRTDIIFLLFSTFSSAMEVNHTTIDYSKILMNLDLFVQTANVTIAPLLGIIQSIKNFSETALSYKSQCEKIMMQQYQYETCVASSAYYNAHVGVDGANNLNLILKQGWCARVANRCKPFILAMKNMARSVVFFELCNNTNVANITNILQSNVSNATTNAMLNDLWKKTKNVTDFIPIANLGANVECTNNSACNFMCNNVLTATGFDQSNFHNLNDAPITDPKSGVGYIKEVDSYWVEYPDDVVADEIGMVPYEKNPFGFGSAANLSVSFALLFTILLALWGTA